MDITNLKTRFLASPGKGLGTPLLLLMLLGMMTLPMPPLLLDFFFTFNITLALVVLLVTIYALRPLDFGSFPSVLLVATLMRLALNIASTRVVLLHGHDGGDAAGKVIQAFGEVVIGGNFAVGFVVFIILVLINFVVITKGAGRISEVTARFTLDAMPGKQMAIDADLNAGLINQEEAKVRRAEVSAESDFYGAMDGASKFVRGDAIAGLLITAINLIGGVAVGMGQHDLSFSGALEIFAILTIGDGLVAQVPGLCLSVASAIMVTRQAGKKEMGEQVLEQLFGNYRVLVVVACVLGFMGLVPGMPHFAFLSLAVLSGGLAYLIHYRANKAAAEDETKGTTAEGARSAFAGGKESAPGLPSPGGELEPEVRELGWEDVHPVDPIGMEVGYRLIPMVDKTQDGQLLDRIKGVRKKLSQELGFLVPAVHIRDNLELGPTAYRITMMGVTIGEAEVYPEKEMAINPGQVFGELKGTPTKDPAFGLDAIWIDVDNREQAQQLGYTVVDASTVVATQLSQLLQEHAADLLGHEEVQQLMTMLEKSAPKLVESLIPDGMQLGTIVKVLQNLLREQVPIKDIRSIAETLAEFVGMSQDPAAITASVRHKLRRLIVQNIVGSAPDLPVITLDPNLEQILLQSVEVAGEEGATIEPGLAERLGESIVEMAQRQEAAGQPVVLLSSPRVRSTLVRFVKHIYTGIHVLSFQEIPDNKQVRIVGSVGQM